MEQPKKPNLNLKKTTTKKKTTTTTTKKKPSNEARKKLTPEEIIRLQNETQRKKKQKKIFSIQSTIADTKICSKELLTEAASYLLRSHYQDVVLERALTDICGYPLCGITISNYQEALSKGKQYKIDSKQKVLYEITELAKFCSEECLIASRFFEAQLSEHEELTSYMSQNPNSRFVPIKFYEKNNNNYKNQNNNNHNEKILEIQEPLENLKLEEKPQNHVNIKEPTIQTQNLKPPLKNSDISIPKKGKTRLILNNNLKNQAHNDIQENNQKKLNTNKKNENQKNENKKNQNQKNENQKNENQKNENKKNQNQKNENQKNENKKNENKKNGNQKNEKNENQNIKENNEKQKIQIPVPKGSQSKLKNLKIKEKEIENQKLNELSEFDVNPNLVEGYDISSNNENEFPFEPVFEYVPPQLSQFGLLYSALSDWCSISTKYLVKNSFIFSEKLNESLKSSDLSPQYEYIRQQLLPQKQVPLSEVGQKRKRAFHQQIDSHIETVCKRMGINNLGAVQSALSILIDTFYFRKPLSTSLSDTQWEILCFVFLIIIVPAVPDLQKIVNDKLIQKGIIFYKLDKYEFNLFLDVFKYEDD